MKKIFILLAIAALTLIAAPAYAQTVFMRYYDPGVPTVQNIWVDPVNGDDNNTGESPGEQPLRTLDAAWQRIPKGETLTGTGYSIMLLSGIYPPESVPVYFESPYGTYEFPVIIQAPDGPGTATLPGLNIFEARYLYLIGLNIEQAGGDVLHCERCDHFYLKEVTITGTDTEAVQETLKVNQSQYVFVENSDISGAWDNAVDFVGVQYGHFQSNRIHNAGDWCMYLKGGSANFRVEGNEYYNCGTGGFTVGQGTGFQYMTPPWIQYEGYDILFANNLIHDAEGAAMGVQGGYNVVMAYNTMYAVGERSHVLEFVFGSRSCDGQPGDDLRENCDAFQQAGGWGNAVISDGANHVRIPNRNVYIYNNVLYNPSGYQSQWQHFAIFAPYSESFQDGANVPVPTLADDNLQIRGNIIWNGPAQHPMGIESDAGCQLDNSTCNVTQLLTENAINTIEPQLAEDYRPASGGNVFSATTYPIPAFPGDDRPADVPESTLEFSALTRDFDGNPRGENGPPGAFAE